MKGRFPTSEHSYITLDIKISVRVESLTRTYWYFIDAVYELLNVHLAFIIWKIQSNGYKNDWAIHIFQSTIDNLIYRFISIIFFFVRRNVPWIAPALRGFVRTMQRKYDRYISNPSNPIFTEYKNYWKFVKSKITSCKRNFDKLKFLRKKYPFALCHPCIKLRCRLIAPLLQYHHRFFSPPLYISNDEKCRL